MLNLSLILETSAKRFPTKAAFSFMETTCSYTEVNAAANKVANGLKAIGINPGDKVALSCPNLPAFPIIYFGILKMGAVVVPLSVLLKKEEIEYHLSDSDAKAYFCFTGKTELPMAEMGFAAFEGVEKCHYFFEITSSPGMPSTIAGAKTLTDLTWEQSVLFEIHRSNADDTCVIIYTSGTTGRPKGAELTNLNLMMNAIAISEQMKNEAKDVMLIVLPLFHAFAMTAMMNAGIYRGCSHILLARFDAEKVFATMQKHNVTVFAGVPTMYWSLLNYTDNKFDYKRIATTLRLCASGGASMPAKVLKDFETRFDVPVMEGYGMSESSCVVTFNPLDLERKPGSVGIPIWGLEVKLLDTDSVEVPVGEKGELVFRGPNVMKGYYNNSADTAKTLQDGWLYSGDIAVKDQDGFYYIVDRIKDMIVRCGFKVYPREVEEVMIKHEAVSLVAVIGIPNEEAGEEVKAFVVLKDNVFISEVDLISWVKERVATYKYPRIVEFVATLPMTATGKILKKELRKS